ncbi:MAG: FAD-binding protein [Chloroflexi bacterium]|nr:FAD-binding protein [Chloroflexota bacterium]
MKTQLSQLSDIAGREQVLSSPEDLACYSYDATPPFESAPLAIVRPGSVQEVVEIIRLAGREKLSLVPRGSGTSVSGGAVPPKGSIVLQMTRLNRILEIDTENLTATVEPGVITSALHTAAEQLGLFYPPDPGSANISTLGGNVAENSGGLRGLKYGVTRDYVLGLEAVLPSGELLRTGGKTVKNVTGYDLTRLLTGSEGTLAVITKIILKLIPLPEAKRSLLVAFRSLDDAARTVSSVIANKVIPATMEIIDQFTLRSIEKCNPVGFPLDVEAVLLIEVDGLGVAVEYEAAKLEQICHQHNAIEIRVAKTPAEGLALYSARRSALPSMARLRPTTIVEDATVPRSRVADMVARISQIAEKHRVAIGTYGHAGDGNLHPTIPFDERDEEETRRVHLAVDEIFQAALEMEGTISGEHGIGLAKAKFLRSEVGQSGINTMKAIKKALDPGNILNPDKMFDPSDQ